MKKFKDLVVGDFIYRIVIPGIILQEDDFPVIEKCEVIDVHNTSINFMCNGLERSLFLKDNGDVDCINDAYSYGFFSNINAVEKKYLSVCEEFLANCVKSAEEAEKRLIRLLKIYMSLSEILENIKKNQ